MQKTIISDTSCLILLDNIGELNLLHQLFGLIFTTIEVASEFESPLPDWFIVTEPKNKDLQRMLENTIDKGEASAIALALEIENSLLIIDDLKGRKVASNYGINITGTLGILIEAKLEGHIELIKPILDKIKSTNFRLSKVLENEILSKCNE